MSARTLHTLALAGGEMVVHHVGTGRPVTYLHGLIGTPPDAPILDALADASLAVTAPCLPGFSGSTHNDDTRNIHDWVFLTSAAIDIAGVAGSTLVASSVGAMVALELAAVRPEAFEHLILLAPMGLWDDADPVADPFATTISQQRRLLTADPTVTSIFFDDPAGMAGDELIEYGVDRYQTRTSGASLVWPIPEHGLVKRIARVSCPVTLVWGSADAIVPIGYLDRFEALLPNVVGRHVIEGAGHLVDWDKPAEVAAIVSAVVGSGTVDSGTVDSGTVDSGTVGSGQTATSG
jgi:pimeloyl-ACP methyl ester carboxylesterase